MDHPLLLLDTGPRVTAELAKNLLAGASIPVLLTGPDFDVAEFGVFAHDTLRGVSLLVAPGSFDAACEILDEAWGEAWREREGGPLAAQGATRPPPPEPPAPGRSRGGSAFGSMLFASGLELFFGILG
jgi:hypothetical protein